MKEDLSGKFIVLEGLDGSGGETKVNLLFDYLKDLDVDVEKLSYPDYEEPIGKLISDFLHKKYDFSPLNQFLLYLSDFLKDKEKINNWLSQGKIIISDRYFTSTIAYQVQSGFSLRKALEAAELFELPKPDLIIYSKISPETSMARKIKDGDELDRYESDKEFLTRLSQTYENLIQNKIFGNWVIVDAEGPIKEVGDEIKAIINEKVNLKLWTKI
jgi:dTMP kinase